MRLADRLRQTGFASPAQEALLNILVTSAYLNGEIAQVLSSFGVTPAQYNVLRILRGSHPEKLTCSVIGARLIDRTPDVTRLLDRLERSGWLARRRSEEDRRVVHVGITEAGLELLASIDPEMTQMNGRMADVLSDEEFATLNALLDRMRSREKG